MECDATKVVKAGVHLVNWQDCLSFPFYAVLKKSKKTRKKRKEIIILMSVYRRR